VFRNAGLLFGTLQIRRTLGEPVLDNAPDQSGGTMALPALSFDLKF
jgi:hypothetical protein